MMPTEFYQPETIFMAVGRGGYVGLVRVEDGRLDVAAAFDPEFVRRRGGLGEAAASVLEESGFPPIKQLAECSPWRGTPALTRSAKQLAGERWFAVGDAAGYVEPFTGEGMAWAMTSGAAVAPLAAEASRGWNPSFVRRWERNYSRIIRSRQGTCRVTAALLRSPIATKIVVRRSVGAADVVATDRRRPEPTAAPQPGADLMSFVLHGLGKAVPSAAVSNEDSLRIARKLAGPVARDSGFLPSVFAGTGNRTRYQVIGREVMQDVFDGTRSSQSVFLPSDLNDSVGPTTGQRCEVYAVEAPLLAVQASRDALVESGFAPRSITHLITVSCTGFVAPGIDLTLIRDLGLRPTVERTHVGFMGCHGALNGLRVANAFTAANPDARVLLCAVELCSIHYHYGDVPEKVVANALFADGAAAVVGTGTGDAEGWRVAATGSCLIPDSADAMGWTIGDHGFEMTLARKVPTLIAKNLRPWMTGVAR